MESFITYVNKGSVEIDLDYFPELQGLTNEELQEELKSGKYYVSPMNNEIMPKELPENISEEIKEEWSDGEGGTCYDSEDFVSLWDWHNESEVDFDKIKNEEHYFLVQD